MSKIHSISVSPKKGMRKSNVEKAYFQHDTGIKDDAHASSDWHRQISLLAQESIDKMVEKGLDVKSGDFAENVTTIGIDLLSLPIGTKLKVGCIDLIISQIGKICHHRCAIYRLAGDCVMPKEGIFGVVRGNGELSVGEKIEDLGKKGLSIGIITLSDRASAGTYEDKTGADIIEYMQKNFETSFIRKEVLPDDKDKLEANLKDFADTQQFDVIITNGSTGVSPRDIAPDVTLPLLEKRLAGFEEVMRSESFKITKTAIVSRAVVGIRGKSLIINLPGSPKAAIENLSVIAAAIEHTVMKIHGDKSDCAK